MEKLKVYVLIDKYEADIIFVFSTKEKAIEWAKNGVGDSWVDTFSLLIKPVY